MSGQPLIDSSGPAVLGKAVERAAGLLEVSDPELAKVLGVSPSCISRRSRRSRAIDPGSKEGELALLFLRVFRSLDALLGSDKEKCRRWLRVYNHHLAGVPADLLRSKEGIVHVIDYLDAQRGLG